MRIAHITDLHLRQHLPAPDTPDGNHSRLMPEFFARALDSIESQAPDLLVVTGDLIDFPFELSTNPELLERGRQDLLLIAGLLSRMTCPVAIVYGNDDLPELFHSVFASALVEQIVAGHRILTFNDAEGPDHVPFRVGLERRRFFAVLDDADPTPQIHVQHFLFWPAPNEDYPFSYGDGAWMRDQIVAAGCVRLVLSGHYHQGVPPFCEKGVWFATAPAFTEPPHSWRIYEISGRDVTCRSYSLAS